MEVLEAISGRRSIRRFLDKDVESDKLEKILEAIRWSPSWANTQCWEVITVREAETKKALQATLPPTNPASKAMVEAPLILVLCGKLGTSGFYKGQVTTKLGDWFMYDLGIATQSLCLAAHSLGLGTVIVGLFDHNKAKEILKVPDGFEVVSMIPVGYAAQVSSPPKRREVAEFLHREQF